VILAIVALVVALAWALLWLLLSAAIVLGDAPGYQA
jgi:hypothetical protein